MANKKYKLTDGNYWATDGVYDFDQGKTQREVNGDLIGAITSLENSLQFTNLDAQQIIKYPDGRIQLKYFDGSAQYIITFNPINKSITQTKSDDGITFTDQWSINNNVSAVVPLMASQNDYTFETGAEFTATQCGKIVQVNGGFVCNTVNSVSPGTLIASGLPKPKNIVFVTLAQRNGAQTSARAVVNASGELYIRFGYVSGNYDCAFTYIAE